MELNKMSAPRASTVQSTLARLAPIPLRLIVGFGFLQHGFAKLGPPGYETNLLYLACFAALVLGGSGPLSIDGLRASRRQLI
jgi:uncharacterized membrane protein YphA (DoxX/SURF4 family)